MVLASVTSTLTDLLSRHGVAAVFLVMALDALLPVGGELTMLLAGALAAGALAGAHPSLFGIDLREGVVAYVVVSLAGTLGYLLGCVAGWWIGRVGGRPLIERHGRVLHLGPERFARAERWFDRHGAAAVLIGRLTPLVRSFISVPAGVLRFALGPYVALSALGSAIWCFGFAAAGWALGSNYDRLHNAFRFVDVAAVLGVVVLAAWGLRRATGRTAARPSNQAG
jgi:membrane protein DedA with SNARE-associated domain